MGVFLLTSVKVGKLRLSPRDLIFLVGHSRLSPRVVFLMLYTSSAYETPIPSAVSHMPSRNFMIGGGPWMKQGKLSSLVQEEKEEGKKEPQL